MGGSAGQYDMFQSAPLTDVRGDGITETAPCVIGKFQSAPLTDVRGDLVALDEPLVFGTERFNPLPSRM